MSKKIFGAMVCLILALPGISIVGVSSENISTIETDKKINTELLENELALMIYQAPGYLGVNLDIENKGAEVLNNVKWSFRTKAAITGTGIFIREKLQEGTIDQINPGEKITLKFRPFNTVTKSPLGIGTMYLNASAQTENIYGRTQKQALILGFFLLMFKETYMDIEPVEAYEKWLNEEFDLIIDVVGLDIYSLGHLPGAVNYIWADGTLNSKIPELDPSWTYLVYCHTDPPSTASAQAMINAGFDNIYRLEGNFAAWKNAGYPIET